MFKINSKRQKRVKEKKLFFLNNADKNKTRALADNYGFYILPKTIDDLHSNFDCSFEMPHRGTANFKTKKKMFLKRSA